MLAFASRSVAEAIFLPTWAENNIKRINSVLFVLFFEEKYIKNQTLFNFP